MAYMQGVLNKLIERLPDGLASEPDSFIYQFGVFHEVGITQRKRKLLEPAVLLLPLDEAISIVI